MEKFPERDWKTFKRLRTKALDRFAQKALKEFRRILDSDDQTDFDRFRELQESMGKHDKIAVNLFSDLRRSTALSMLCSFHEYGFVQKDELSTLSSETQEWIEKASA